MVMLWNLVVLVGFVVERGGGQKAGHPTYVRRLANALSQLQSKVSVHTNAIHRNSEYFHEATAFRPERWLAEARSNEPKIALLQRPPRGRAALSRRATGVYCAEPCGG